jgi:1L-myo-inositol 1-phosphate cytidylyltransferase
MEALIIAAGEGTRMKRSGVPKPLVPVRGKRLLELVLTSARAAGIEDFKIVVGFEADRIVREIGSGRELGVRIEYVHNPRWKSGNGLSVAAARDHLKDRFVLLMGDHLFDPAALSGLLSLAVRSDDSALIVDRKLQGTHFDPADATKVWVENGLVRRIGKGLSPFNALDTGLFSYSPRIFEALDESVARGEDSLTEANRVLAGASRLRALDIGDRLWVDVDDPAMLRRAEDHFPGLLDPKSPGDQRSEK